MLLEGALQELCQKQQHPLPFSPSASVPFQWEEVSGMPRNYQLVTSTPLRDCISVPFQGVEVPGKPQKTFMNDPLVITTQSSHTNRAVAAVPFNWEEKPGKPKPFFPIQNPISSSITLSQKSFNSSHVGDSPNFSPRTLSERLKSIFQVKLSRSTKLSSAKISLPTQNAYTGQHIEERGAEEVLALNFFGGSEGEEEMFELDLNAPPSNGLKEVRCSSNEGVSKSSSSSSLGSERMFSSLSGHRTRDSDATTPALLANCLMTMMEISKAVPVEDSFKQKMSFPSLISVDSSDKEDSWDTLEEIQKKNLMSGYQQCLRFHSMQPANSPKGILSRNVYDSPKSITWEGMEVIGEEEDRRGPGAVDAPCLDLGFIDEKRHQLKRSGNNGNDSSSSSPLPSTLDFVEGRPPQSVAQGGGYRMDMVLFGTYPQSGKHSNCNQASAKEFKHPSEEPNYFQENPMFDARVEETKAGDFIGRYGPHSKRTRFRPKRQTLCMELKMGMISCCSWGAIHARACHSRASAKTQAINWRKNGQNHNS